MLHAVVAAIVWAMLGFEGQLRAWEEKDRFAREKKGKEAERELTASVAGQEKVEGGGMCEKCLVDYRYIYEMDVTKVPLKRHTRL